MFAFPLPIEATQIYSQLVTFVKQYTSLTVCLCVICVNVEGTLAMTNKKTVVVREMMTIHLTESEVVIRKRFCALSSRPDTI